MPTLLISSYLIDIEDRFFYGAKLSSIEAQVLNSIWLKRFFSRLNYWSARNPNASQAELLNEAARLESSLEIELNEVEDPIAIEALAIAREQIELKLAKLNLPSPNNINLHAIELVRASSDIRARARISVEAKLKAASEMLRDTRKLEEK
jgi:hypothetical protein